MPSLETELLLDVLFGAIVLLFVPLGVWRGVAKEAMVAGGILLGAAIADAWATRWGDDLATEVDLAPDTARFVVAALALVGCAVVLGYGGGAALGRVPQGVLARLAGGLLAGLNAALLLAYVLAFIERYLRGDGLGAVDDGIVGRALLRDFDWLLVGAAGLLLACVLLGLLVTSIRRRREPPDLATADADGGYLTPRQRPVRLAQGGDAGKYEPAESRPGRFGGPGTIGQTTPLAGRAETRLSEGEPGGTGTWPRPRPTAGSDPYGNGHAPAPPVADEWLRRASAMTRPGERDATPEPPGADPQPAEPRRRFGADYGASGTAGSLGRRAQDSDQRRCPTCGANVGARDVFCAECGQTL